MTPHPSEGSSPTAPQSASSQPSRRLGMRVIGVGGAGCNAVAALHGRAIGDLECMLLNADLASLQRLPQMPRHTLGERTFRGLGSGGDPERARVAAEEEAGLIRRWCEGADMVVVVAGLGGGTGTGVAPVVCRVAHEAGALVLAVAILPFECEGSARSRRANQGLAQLKSVADAFVCLPNQALLRSIDEKTSLVEAFKLSNDFVADAVGGLWRLLYQRGLMNIEFADVCSAFRAQHMECSLASAEIRGEYRAVNLMERLLAHPLIQGGAQLASAKQLLVSLVGGPELSMKDVEFVVEQLRRHAEHANIVVGAILDEQFRERMAVTVVAGGGVASMEVEDDDDSDSGAGLESGLAGKGGRMSGGGDSEAEPPLLREESMDEPARTNPGSRFVAPPPDSTPESVDHLARNQMPQTPSVARSRRKKDVWKQGMLNLEIVSKGRFEKSEPTIHRGQDLDVPTFVRRGVVLN